MKRSLTLLLLLVSSITMKCFAQCVQVSLSPVTLWVGAPGLGNDSITITITANTIPKKYRLFNTGVQWAPVVEFPLSFVLPTSTRKIAVMPNTQYNFEVKSVTNAGVVDNICNSDVIPFTYGPVLALSNMISSKIVNNEFQWSMLRDDDVHKYIIEKSNDGRSFIALGDVVSLKTNTMVSYRYSLTEYNIFYRLKMLHTDGTFAYTSVIKNHEHIITTISVYPNPVVDKVTIQGLTATATKPQILLVYNTLGICIQTFVARNNTVQIDLQSYPKGLYYIKINQDIIKIIKQ
jgi:Secretion system C-terminal sorting domain